MSRIVTTATVVALLLIASLPVTARADGGGLKKLQGTWIGTEDGQEDKGKVTLSVEGNKIQFQGWQPQEWYKGTIELGEKGEIDRLYATIKDCPIAEFVDKVCNAIYEIDDESLSVASRPPGDPKQPSGFDDPECRSFSLKKQP